MVKSYQKLSNWHKPTWKTCWFTLRTSQIIRAKTWKNNMQRFPTNPDKSLTQNLCYKKITLDPPHFLAGKKLLHVSQFGSRRMALHPWSLMFCCFSQLRLKHHTLFHMFDGILQIYVRISPDYDEFPAQTCRNTDRKNTTLIGSPFTNICKYIDVMSHDVSYDSNVPWKVGISHVWAIDIIRSYEN